MSSAIYATILVLIVFLLLILIGTYNSLVTLRKNVDMSWTNIDIILKQRFDEIPQVIELINQYVSYEKSMFEKIIASRDRYTAASNIESKIEASNEISRELQRVFLYSEHNPELKANASFLQLQKRVSELEEVLSDRREFLNSTITIYNSKIAQFPEMFFAKLLNYNEMELFSPQAFELEKPSLKIKID